MQEVQFVREMHTSQLTQIHKQTQSLLKEICTREHMLNWSEETLKRITAVGPANDPNFREYYLDYGSPNQKYIAGVKIQYTPPPGHAVDNSVFYMAIMANRPDIVRDWTAKNTKQDGK